MNKKSVVGEQPKYESDASVNLSEKTAESNIDDIKVDNNNDNITTNNSNINIDTNNIKDDNSTSDIKIDNKNHAENTSESNRQQAEESTLKGSPIGKFKSVDSLHSAYLDLEKQFTKKSQRLSELEKLAEQDNVAKNTPCYARENWRNQVKEFVATNKNALDYASEISDELMKDNNLACLPNSLELAYAKILARKYKTADELVSDKDFLNNHILKNNDIKNQIIKEYVKSVNFEKSPPVVLSNKRSSVGFSLPQKPENLQEAKKMVEKLFF